MAFQIAAVIIISLSLFQVARAVHRLADTLEAPERERMVRAHLEAHIKHMKGE